ncbi:hypothetical protein BaRGS_00033636, partial [Batillaria attramentaria]
ALETLHEQHTRRAWPKCGKTKIPRHTPRPENQRKHPGNETHGRWNLIRPTEASARQAHQEI